jgi:hypothetical protein
MVLLYISAGCHCDVLCGVVVLWCAVQDFLCDSPSPSKHWKRKHQNQQPHWQQPPLHSANIPHLALPAPQQSSNGRDDSGVSAGSAMPQRGSGSGSGGAGKRLVSEESKSDQQSSTEGFCGREVNNMTMSKICAINVVNAISRVYC